ncbi:MAG TPA: hypothetical protein VKH18_03570 [Terriglobales bacterium]|nr:hypothetical protein [Terriglobales bacterium]
MTDKISRYRKLAESLAELGDDQAKAIATDRYKLMYHYFVRCAGLTSAVVLLVETGHLAAAYALQKSLVDAMLNGLYIGYVAPEKEIEESVALALKGRCTGHSGMGKRAKQVDEALRRRRSFMTGMFEDIVKRAGERLNEFGHGGLLSTALGVKSLPAEVGYKVLADSVLVLHIFLSNVFMLENLDLAPLEALQREFDGTKND